MIAKIYAGLIKLRRVYKYKFSNFEYIQEKYANSFLVNAPIVKDVLLKEAEKKIYIFWTGENEITPNRMKGIEELQKYSEVKVELITVQNLQDYVLKEYPLHEGYQYMSLNHRSDYLRAYFMLHYGGGYSDIKPNKKSWVKAFDQLNKDVNKWVLGYQELGHWGIRDDIREPLKSDLKENYLYLIGNGAFIYKPNNPIAQEWMNEIHRRLDELIDDLRERPAIDFFGKKGGYPIPWAHITGDITQSLYLKYNQRVMHNDAVLPVLKDYR